MSIKNSWILVLFVAGIASCATSSKSTPIRETTAETKAEVPVDSTSTKDATQPPADGEITLDGAKTTEVDIGVTGTSTGPVVVDSAIKTPQPKPEMTQEEMEKALIEAVTGGDPAPTGVVNDDSGGGKDDSGVVKDASGKPVTKVDKKTKKKGDQKVVEKPKVPGQLIIDSGDAAPVAVPVEP